MADTHKKSIRAVIYARTSGDDNDLKNIAANLIGSSPTSNARSVSIAEQIRLCRNICERNGYQIVGEFQDLDISGRTYPKGFSIPDPAFDDYFANYIKRPSKRERVNLGRLLENKAFDVIVVRDIFRLLRPAFQSHLGNHLWQMFSKRRITLHAVDAGEIDSSRFDQYMLLNLQLQIADQAKRQEVEASRRSLKAKKDAGFLASNGTCFGFRSVPGKSQTVEPVEAELKIVRLIFKKYLAGMPALQIAKMLNDDLRVKTMKGKMWNVHNVSRILQRPAYCGMRPDSSGRLIQHQVYPHGENAIISEKDFQRVQASFEKRKRFEIRTQNDLERERRQDSNNKPLKGGSRLGTSKRGVIRPFSGLLKCGCCGKHLSPLSVINKYYSDEIPVRTIHYICPVSYSTKRPEFADCSKVRIKEEYPKDSLNLGITPNGNGLIEALFPLLFHGQILRLIREKQGTEHLVEIRDRYQSELDRLEKHQDDLFGMKERNEIDDESFRQGIQRAATRRNELKQRISGAESELAKMSNYGLTVPQKAFLDPEEMPRDVMRELAHETFEEIIVFPDHITVRLKARNPDGKIHYFEIPRIRNRNVRGLPFWKGRINTPELNAKTVIGITYFLKSTQVDDYAPLQIVYSEPEHMEVNIVGNNESVDKKRSEPHNVSALSRFLKSKLGEPPSIQRSLEVSSDVFFGPKIAGFNKIPTRRAIPMRH